MLIDSPRLKPGDRDHWEMLERYDHLLAEGVAGKATDSYAILDQWVSTHPGAVVSVSWGKDSTVIADLAAHLDHPPRIVWVRSDPFEMPECEDVRDAFLTKHPHVDYEERIATLRVPRRREPGYEAHITNPRAKGQDVLRELIHEPHINGVRGTESKTRRDSIRWHGTSTTRTCRPILFWTAEEVFAYLAAKELPVHPAYAMSYAGHLDRRWIRVHPLCSHHEESSIHGRDMASWEDDYYHDAIHHALTQAAKQKKEKPL